MVSWLQKIKQSLKEKKPYIITFFHAHKNMNIPKYYEPDKLM